MSKNMRIVLFLLTSYSWSAAMCALAWRLLRYSQTPFEEYVVIYLVLIAANIVLMRLDMCCFNKANRCCAGLFDDSYVWIFYMAMVIGAIGIYVVYENNNLFPENDTKHGAAIYCFSLMVFLKVVGAFVSTLYVIRYVSRQRKIKRSELQPNAKKKK